MTSSLGKQGMKSTRENLLRTAINLYYRKGYSNTSIREIGSKAGISTSIIYHYFGCKEEILFEIVHNASQDLLETLLEIDQKVQEPLECFQKMIEAHVLLFSLKRMKELKITISEDIFLRGKRIKIIKDIQLQIYNLYNNKLKEIRDTGLLRDIDPTVMTFSIFGIINGFFHWYKDGGSLTKEDVARNILDFILKGILKQDPNGHGLA
jgi:AcrR family transcriptional regulator